MRLCLLGLRPLLARLTLQSATFGDLTHQRLEKHDQAVSEYDRAIELDPQNFQAHFNRGVAHQTLGNLEKAVQDFKRAVELRPDYAQAYLNRGKAFRQLQQFKQALGDFKIAARLGDLDAQAILVSMGISSVLAARDERRSCLGWVDHRPYDSLWLSWTPRDRYPFHGGGWRTFS